MSPGTRARPVRAGSVQPGDLLVVTTRPAVRVRIQAVCAELGLPEPTFVEELAEVLESGADCAVLLLDFGSCCVDTSLHHVVRTWELYRPGTEVVLFTPLVDREREMRATVGLLKTVRSVEVRIMTASDFYRDEVWRNLGRMRERAALEAELRSEFLEAVRRTGRPIRAEPLVLELLHAAPQQADIQAVATTALRRVRVNVRSTAEGAGTSERKELWRLLRRARQLPPSWLLVVFRVLWYTKLLDKGWRAAEIAAFLGLPSPRHFRRMVERRFGLGLRALKRVRHVDAVRWAATLVTADYAELSELPVTTLAESLLANAAAPPSARARDE